MRKIYAWCLDKVRNAIGAIAFAIPRICTRVRRSTKLVARLVIMIMMMFLFLCPLVFRSSMYVTSFGPNDFTYTGQSEWVSDGGIDFRLRFLTSGTFTPKKNLILDLFLVGGGGGGGGSTNDAGDGGGGGGYTGTFSSVSISAGTEYPIVIGAGGACNGNGVASSAFGYSKNGGGGGDHYYGMPGGSGGGAAGVGSSHNGAPGGSDGSNGTGNASYAGGAGQGSTTREFGEAGATLYAGGGGGGAYNATGSSRGEGGAGGGGAGGLKNTAGDAGTANTGGGGGGGGGYAKVGGAGGSGIAIIRNHRV